MEALTGRRQGDFLFESMAGPQTTVGTHILGAHVDREDVSAHHCVGVLSPHSDSL